MDCVQDGFGGAARPAVVHDLDKQVPPVAGCDIKQEKMQRLTQCCHVLLCLQFCFTGRMGLLGNLTTAQIVEQLVEARRWLAEYTAQQQLQPQPQQQQQQSSQQQQQQEQLAGADEPVLQTDGQHNSLQSSSSSSSKRVQSTAQVQPPRINNIVFMVSTSPGNAMERREEGGTVWYCTAL